MAKVTRVKGNRLRLAIPLQTVTVTEHGTVTADYNVPAGAEVTVTLTGTWKTYKYVPEVNGNLLTITDEGTLPAGTYAVETTVVQADGEPLRSKYCNMVEISDCNDGVTQEYDDFISGSVTLEEQIFYFAKGDKGDPGTTDYNDLQNKPDLSGFITADVNNLVNYYLKSETYTKAEVQALVNAVKQFTYKAVPTLPAATADTMHKIYLVPSADPQAQNVKDEYITIDNGTEAQTRYTWEQIGSTAIDLSGYYTSTQTDAAITAALNTALAAYTTTADLTTLLAAKQDKIDSSHKLSADLVEDGSTNKAYTAAEKIKLNGIEQGAQVNVNPDWNAASGSSAEILNKPTIPDAQIQSDWNQSDNTQKDFIKNKPTTMGASGSGHKEGLVPDTPSTAGTTKFLREDGTWEVPAGGSAAAYTPTLQSAPTSSTTTYTKDGQVVNFEIGQFVRVSNQNNPTGYDMYQLYDLATENNATTAVWRSMDIVIGDINSVLDNINGEDI